MRAQGHICLSFWVDCAQYNTRRPARQRLSFRRGRAILSGYETKRSVPPCPSSLTEGNVRRALSRFAIPFLGASLLQFLYGAVDLIVVGQFADQAGIAAVSTGSQVMQAVTDFIIGLSTGGTVLVGQYLGARRGEDVNRAIGTLFSLFALIAVVLAAAFALSTNAIVALMQVPAAAVAPARQYLFICACGLVFITGYNMVSGVLRGLGDSKRPMYFVLVACIINIVGDLLLVGVFGLGAAGAACRHRLPERAWPWPWRYSAAGTSPLILSGVPFGFRGTRRPASSAWACLWRCRMCWLPSLFLSSPPL